MIQKFLPMILKAVVAGVFGSIERLLKSWRRDRALKKLVFMEAKVKADGRKTKILKKVEKRRSRWRSDPRYAKRLRDKFTRR